MANIYVQAAGSNTAPYDTWAKAATSLGTAVTASAANDTIWVYAIFNEAGLAGTTYTPAAGVKIISTADNTHEPPTAGDYAAGATVATTTTGTFTITSGEWFGIVFKAGSAANAASVSLGNTSIAGVTTFEDCTFQLVGTGSSSRVNIGANTASNRGQVITRNCTFKYAATGHGISWRGWWLDFGSNLDGGSTHPTTLIPSSPNNPYCELNGTDFSGNANTYFPVASGWHRAVLVNCKLNGSATVQATQTSDGQGEVWGYDCASGDTHYNFFHYSYRGSTVATTAAYVTADGASYDGVNRHSLLITGVNVTFSAPYWSPWIDRYTDNLVASVTPYFEIARNGSATPLKDDEVWAEVMAKTTSGVPRTTLYTDRRAVIGTGADQPAGVGTSAWTGLGTSVSQKIDAGSAFTPAEIGHARGRIALAAATSIYADFNLRGVL